MPDNCLSSASGRPHGRSLRSVFRAFSTAALTCGALLFPAACGGGGGSGGSAATPGANTGDADLLAISYGRLVDVFGLQDVNGVRSSVLFRRDVVINLEVEDGRLPGEIKADADVRYDFIGADPSSLQTRLLIPRTIGSPEFDTLLEEARQGLANVAAASFGQNTVPFDVVPRNAAIQLTFSQDLGIDQSFFVEQNSNGVITGIKNQDAVQVLEITGDPDNGGQAGVFRVLPVRIVPDGNRIAIDPVLLGSEGIQLNTRNNATGLPDSPNQFGANIRIALSLEGPLALPGLRADARTGLNNNGVNSIIRDFRSGNPDDNSVDFARGFLRDPLPPRVLGQLQFFLQEVSQISNTEVEVLVFKAGLSHDIDRNDIFEFVVPGTNTAIRGEVACDPGNPDQSIGCALVPNDFGAPGVQRVRVRVTADPAQVLPLDPRNQAGFAAAAAGPQAAFDQWLIDNAPRAILVTEYTGPRPNPANPTQTLSDDPSLFVRFTPQPLANDDGSRPLPNEFVSPFAGAVMTLTKPVDVDTVKPLDTFFFATRNLLSGAERQDFLLNTHSVRIDSTWLTDAKYRTPHLVASRLFDEDGSQTTLRLQPLEGFFLDDRMRNAASPADFTYFLHVLGGPTGVRDLAGNALDFKVEDQSLEEARQLVIPFTVDTRRRTSGLPFFEDNIVAYVCRRFAARDEDEQPSIYVESEVRQDGQGSSDVDPTVLQDVFGGIFYEDEQLVARPPDQVSRIADNRNQQPVASQNSIQRWCPIRVGSEDTLTSNTAANPFGQGIQNPLNPFGARLQTVWRELDLSLSRTDPADFNLDVEAAYYGVFTQDPIVFDEFDRVRLLLGHSEYRPEPCIGAFTASPEMGRSGLTSNFQNNYANNPGPNSGVEFRPEPHIAYDAPLTIDPALAILEPSGVNRFMPLPEFQEPFFVWRDETVDVQGGISNEGSDRRSSQKTFEPYIISPFLGGAGRLIGQDFSQPAPPVAFRRVISTWENGRNFSLDPTSGVTTSDSRTGGLLGPIALPLLGDFQTFCDRADLPAGNGFVALGVNGWQISLAVTSSFEPNFRAYSGGRQAVPGSCPALCVDEGNPGWTSARGAFDLSCSPTRAADNSFYWIWFDFLKRSTVATAGFFEVRDPHRVRASTAVNDPRLGPYAEGAGQTTLVPAFQTAFEPPLNQLAPGTQIIPEYSAASIIGGTFLGTFPWRWEQDNNPPPAANSGRQPYEAPDAQNFPLDPFKAGDAQIRKWDQRQNRNWWTYFYNRTVTDYTSDLEELMDPNYLDSFGSPSEAFGPADVLYVNWRFRMVNNVTAQPPVSPTLESFSMAYRFEQQN